MLEINEIFGPTIQGEGKRIGVPSVFIRFSKCNFKCSGFNVLYEVNGIKKYGCDTFYAVDSSFKNTWKKYPSHKDIINEVNKLTKNYTHKFDIVITGGEPLLNWNNEEFQELLKYYINNGHFITIETNASINIDINKEYQNKVLFSMSVKLSNSNESKKKRLNYSNINHIIENSKESYLKFVVDTFSIEDTKKEIEEIRSNIKECDIYLMPMGDERNHIEKNTEEVIQMCIDNNYKFSDRLHIRVWDNKRGV